MSFKQKLSKETGIRENLLPSSYQVIGDILLIKFMKIKLLKQKKDVAKAIVKMFPYVKSVCEIKGVGGELREPKIVKLIGTKTETIHKENNIFFKLDVSKIMFSKGNQNERKRLIEKVKKDEVIVDMFAGIGYFSIPIAKFTKAKRIIAIEKNITAYRYLSENIRLNKIGNVSPILGDNRRIDIVNADRIIMGYFPHTEKFLPFALKFSKPGTIIHFHNTYRKDELWKRPISDIETACKKLGMKYKIIEKKKVKPFAPNVFHVVVDCEIN